MNEEIGVGSLRITQAQINHSLLIMQCMICHKRAEIKYGLLDFTPLDGWYCAEESGPKCPECLQKDTE